MRGHAHVIERRLETTEEVATTWITAGELFYGAAKSKDAVTNRELVVQLLETMTVLEAGLAAAQFFGILRAELESVGRRLPDADLWIGAIARARRATVVTGNARHFDRMRVPTENWMR